MRYDEPNNALELTERNIRALLAKLDDPLSARTLGKAANQNYAGKVLS